MFFTPDLDSGIFQTFPVTLFNSCPNHGDSPPPHSLGEEAAAGKLLMTIRNIGMVMETLAVPTDDKLLVGTAYLRDSNTRN